MDIKKLLGKKIKYFRILRGYSQEKFSELLNISQRTLSGIECGNNFLTSNTLERILEVLKIKPSELFKIEEYQEPKIIIAELIQDIKSLENNEEKLQLTYRILKSIINN